MSINMMGCVIIFELLEYAFCNDKMYKQKMPHWLRYVDEAFTFIKEENINGVINIPNDFHPNIKLTYS